MSATTGPRKFKFIGCEIVYREACYLAAVGPNHVDVEFLRKGLHDLETADMIAKVQATIDAVDRDAGYEAILLGYGRCNDGLAGVQARDIPLVLPRAHDCITLFFGSRTAYSEYFNEHPGTYYMTTGWSERDDFEEGKYAQPAYGQMGVMGKLGLTESYEELVAKHGKENAGYIISTLGDSMKNYSHMLYLKMGVCDETPFIRAAREFAAGKGWDFKLQDGDLSLMQKLFMGEWDDDFLIVPSGRKIIARNDEFIVDVE